MIMTPTTHRAVRSIRACERLNLIQALQATIASRHRLARYHRLVSQQCRADARSLQTTSAVH